jgi:2,3-dihydroxybiphenyl 1,2-dioxygenase
MNIDKDFPMTRVIELGYLGIEARGLGAWQRFGVDLLGLQLAHGDGRTLRLRMDGKAHRWIIQQGPSDDLAFTGYECASEADLNALAARLRAAGSEVHLADAALLAARQVQHLVWTTDPLGNRVELYVGLADATTPFESSRLLSSFVTSVGGAGHAVLMEHGMDRQRLLDWYGLLGLKLTDVIDEKMAPEFTASVAFLHCNARHHTLALANMPFPKRMHHFMVEVQDMRDVGLAYDRCLDAGQPFEMTLGMHPNDRMFSFYVRSPSGFNIEFGWGGLVIDETTWTVQHLDRLSTWGHRRPQAVAEMLRG